ncbi:hypothetical protein DAI22_03g396800 [Oryza sativa Japonica Group]|jgi:hypothetical protein|nr:hypothetical protein DAI22_03g396800 [Oryza sativa Japonica Group]
MAVADVAFKALTAGLGVATLYLAGTFSVNVYRGLSWHSEQSVSKTLARLDHQTLDFSPPLAGEPLIRGPSPTIWCYSLHLPCRISPLPLGLGRGFGWISFDLCSVVFFLHRPMPAKLEHVWPFDLMRAHIFLRDAAVLCRSYR